MALVVTHLLTHAHVPTYGAANVDNWTVAALHSVFRLYTTRLALCRLWPSFASKYLVSVHD
jgi:hypothetical protein